MNNADVIIEQAKLIERRIGHAAVTILHADGSTPRTSGRLIVTEDGGSIGSIGGGEAERMAIADALECLKLRRSMTKDYDMVSSGSNTGMVCGGSIRVFIESYCAPAQLVMCGGGHVGGAVLRLARFLGYDTVLLDERSSGVAADEADRFINVTDYGSGLEGLELYRESYAVIATPGHIYDMEALYAALKKDFGYIGMIGSRKKVAAVFDKLTAKGVPKEALLKVRAPIGLSLGGETPEEIALSIMAEIQSVRYGGTGAPLSRPCAHPK